MKSLKILTVLTALLLVVSLTACSVSKGKENKGNDSEITSILAADAKTMKEASEMHKKLMDRETAIFFLKRLKTQRISLPPTSLRFSRTEQNRYVKSRAS